MNAPIIARSGPNVKILLIFTAREAIPLHKGLKRMDIHYIPVTSDILDEAETRRLIDAQLNKAGWEADTKNLRYSKGVRPVRGATSLSQSGPRNTWTCVPKAQQPYQIPHNWRWVRLGGITDIIGGGIPSKKEKTYHDNGDIPWISPADLSGYADIYIAHGAKSITRL